MSTASSSSAPTAMPPRACDCHTHVFGPASRYPYAADRHYTPGEASVAEMLALHSRLGIERVVIVQPSPYGTDNRCTLDAVTVLNADGADRARAVVVVDEQVTPQALRAMHAQGARGVRINLETSGANDPAAARAALESIAGKIADLGWHVQMFTNPHVIVNLADAIGRLPVPVVLDHHAGMRVADPSHQAARGALVDLIAGGNVYVKLSAAHRASALPDCADVQPLAQAFLQCRSDRMVWGTDWPHPGAWPGTARDPAVIERFHPIDDGAALERLRRWVPEADRFAAVLADNPARLYWYA
ncbi:MAG TPA: amidohydrolase family protein [Bordetella sp.]|nr:amidohydrolase family protein [Bordetella sp.]